MIVHLDKWAYHADHIIIICLRPEGDEEATHTWVYVVEQSPRYVEISYKEALRRWADALARLHR